MSGTQKRKKISKVPPFLKEKRDVLEEKGSVSWWQQLVEDARGEVHFGIRRTIWSSYVLWARRNEATQRALLSR